MPPALTVTSLLADMIDSVNDALRVQAERGAALEAKIDALTVEVRTLRERQETGATSLMARIVDSKAGQVAIVLGAAAVATRFGVDVLGLIQGVTP